MPEPTQMHHVLNISDKRAEEISKDVITALGAAGQVDKGTKKLMQQYDAESLLAGMRLMQIIRMNGELHIQQRKTISVPKHPERN